MKSIPLAYFGPFWSKFWALFKKVAGRSMYIVAGGTPNSRDIFFDIERVSHNNIGRQGALKKFLCKNPQIFGPRFFHQFFPVINPCQNGGKIWLEKQHVFFR